jgi:hypothetical protein
LDENISMACLSFTKLIQRIKKEERKRRQYGLRPGGFYLLVKADDVEGVLVSIYNFRSLQQKEEVNVHV